MEVGKEKLCNPEQITWALWAFTEYGPHGLKAVPLEACGSLESQSSFLLCPPHVFHALGGGLCRGWGGKTWEQQDFSLSTEPCVIRGVAHEAGSPNLALRKLHCAQGCCGGDRNLGTEDPTPIPDPCPQRMP